MEWNSNMSILKQYIKENLNQGPKSIQANMRTHKQIF